MKANKELWYYLFVKRPDTQGVERWKLSSIKHFTELKTTSLTKQEVTGYTYTNAKTNTSIYITTLVNELLETI